MAARPRQDYSYHVKKRGPSWVGFWRIFEGDKLVVKQRVLGPRRGVTKTEAMERHATWVRENVPAYGAVPDKPTLRALWERHIAEARAKLAKEKLHPKYVGTKSSLWVYLEPLGDRIAASITPAEIEDLFDSVVSMKTGAPLAPESKGHLRNLTRQLLSMVGSTAVTDAKMRFTGRRKGATLSIEQIAAIRAQLTGRDRTIFDVLAFLGPRAIEARKLARRHVSKLGYVDIPGTKTNLAADVVPVPPELQAELIALAELAVTDDQPILFEQESHRTWLEEVLQPAAKLAGVNHIDFKMMRRTALTHTAKTDRGAASRLGRHSNSTMLDAVYDSPDLDRVRVAQGSYFDEVARERVN